MSRPTRRKVLKMMGMSAAALTVGGPALTRTGLTDTVQAAGLPSTVGSWQVLSSQTNFTAIHAAVLQTGKFLFVAGSDNNPDNHAAGRLSAEIWDGSAGFPQVPPSYDFFCSGHTFLADGDLLIAGGTSSYPAPTYPNGQYYGGTSDSAYFDPVTQRFSKAGSMAGGRWYCTVVTLGDGSVLAMSGLDASGNVNLVPEIYDPVSNGWSTRPAVSPKWPLYPHLVLMRSGQLFYTGGSTEDYNIGVLNPGFHDPQTSAWTGLPALSATDRREAASVLLPPAQDQRVMIIGGGDPSVNNVDIIDLKSATPAYQTGPTLLFRRRHVGAVLLPNGKLFVCNGGQYGRGSAPVLQSEMYDPSTNTWTQMATATVARLYHSVAFLLPDGRVATAGSQPVYAQPGETRIEVYSPPYLFTGSRPAITAAPTEVSYGANISISVSIRKNRSITAVNLVRPGSVTHSVDTGQRLVAVTFQRVNTSTLSAQVPQERNVAPPGWYMLFVLDDQGAPSVASWVHLNP